MENENRSIKKVADVADNKMLIPGAIIVAGFIIAGAVVYTGLPNGNSAIQTPPAEEPGQPSAAAVGEVLKIKEEDFVQGNRSAKVVIVEYGDFQCPFCGKFAKETKPQIYDNYVKTGKAAFIWRDFAFLGEESFRASEAARCAGEQGKFWEYHDKLFANQNGENEGAFADANLKKFAEDLQLDTAKFNLCFASGKYKAAIGASTEGGRRAGVRGTPATFVDGKFISGAVPFTTFKQLIEEALKK